MTTTTEARFAVLWHTRDESRQHVKVFSDYDEAYDFLCTLPVAADCDWKYIETVD